MPHPHRHRVWIAFWLLAVGAFAILALDAGNLFPGGWHSFVESAGVALFLAAGVTLVRALRASRAMVAADLAAERDMLIDLMQSVPDGVALWDADGKLRAYNDAFLRKRSLPEAVRPGLAYRDFVANALAKGRVEGGDGDTAAYLARRLAAFAAADGAPHEIVKSDGAIEEIRFYRARGGGVVAVYRDTTELRRRDAELEAERARQADILAAIPDGIVLWNADEKLAVVNAAAARMPLIGGVAEIGIDYAEFARRSLEKDVVVTAEGRDLPTLEERRANHANPTGEPQEFRYRDGTWMEVRKFRARDGGVVAVYRDVTQRKRDEAALTNERGRLEDIMESLPDGILLWDARMRLTAFNPAATSSPILGGVAEIGMTYRDFVARHLANKSILGPDTGAVPDLDERLADQGNPTGEPQEFRYQGDAWFEVRKFRARDGGVVAVYRDVTQRKRAETALALERGRLADIMETIPDGIVLWDKERRLVAFNRAAGASRAKAARFEIGMSFDERVRALIAGGMGGDDPAGFAAARLAEVAEPNGAPLEIVWPDGRTDEIRRFPSREGGVVALSRDITERKRSEAELERQRRLLQEIMDALPDGLQVWGPDGRLVAFNRKAADQRAAEAKLEPGIHYADFIRRVTYSGSIPEVAGAEEAHIARQIRDHSGLDSYTREVARAGGRWEEVRKVATSDGGRLSLLRDVTERKRAEAELERQRRLLQEIMDALPDGLQVWGPDDTLVAFNRRAAEQRARAVPLTLGVKYEDFIRRSAYSGSIPAIVGDEEAYIARRLRDHANPVASSREVARADGRWEEMRKVATSDGGRLSLFRDVTDAKRAQAELEAQRDELARRLEERERLMAERDSAEAASRAKTEFLAMMSHELRTPMNGVIATTGLLARTRLADEQRLYLDTVQRSAQALLTIIDDVLDWAKLEEGRIEIEAVDCAPAQIADNVVSLLRPAADQKGIHLTLEFDPALPEFGRLDPARLRQILLNLVGNAVKFTAEGGVTVRLTAEPAADGHMLRLEIADTGIGIAPEALPRLFDRFTQADGSIARRYGGTGLGLAIVKRLLDLMGGSIEVRSRPGAGSRFVARLPMAPGQRPIGTAAPLLPAPARALKLLVAEDNAINRMVVEHLLRELGHSAEFAQDGAEAVTKARDQDYDAILMDVQMPDIDGIQATRLIRALDGERARVPIVALTANAMAGDRERYLSAGMDDYVSKPIDAYALAAALARIGGGPAPDMPPREPGGGPLESPAQAAGQAALAGLVEALKRAGANSD